MKKVINILVVVAIIAAIIVVLKMNKKANQQQTALASVVSTAIPVQLDVVVEEAFTPQFTSNGVLEPIKELSFVSDVAGRVVRIAVEKGDKVQKGQTLIQVDDEMLKADYTASEAAYKALKTDYDRFEKSKESGGVSAQQLDNIRTQLIAAESRLVSSKRRLSDATVKAPMAGYINERYIEVGAYLNPGARLFDLVDDSKFKLKCTVTETQVMLIKKGQSVTISCDQFPDQTFTGTLSFIGKKVGSGLNYPVEITLPAGKDLMTGLYVSAQFGSKQQQKGLLIPRNAVSGGVKSASVFVVEEGIAHRRNVTIGSMIGSKVHVLQGVQAGDSIVVAGLIDVSDGIQVVNRKQSAR